MLTSKDLKEYKRIVWTNSGGKDSLAGFLHLLELGVPRSKIEMHHHCIDGKDPNGLFDWPFVPAYNRALADAFKVPCYFSWREGGIEREMLRSNAPTAPVHWDRPDGTTTQSGGKGRRRSTPCGVCEDLCMGCRGKFPQVSGDLKVRWCSAYAKIMCLDSIICNDARFTDGKTLVITGERAEESPMRAKYKVFGPHRSDLRNGKKYQRHVDHWLPVHGWSEAQVWEIMERHSVNPAYAYQLGWGRLSCMTCIFGSDDQWASANFIDPQRIKRMSDYEVQFQCSIHRTKYLTERLQNAKPYEDMDPFTVAKSLSTTYDEPVFLRNWKLPKGAFTKSAGPS